MIISYVAVSIMDYAMFVNALFKHMPVATHPQVRYNAACNNTLVQLDLHASEQRETVDGCDVRPAGDRLRGAATPPHYGLA